MMKRATILFSLIMLCFMGFAQNDNAVMTNKLCHNWAWVETLDDLSGKSIAAFNGENAKLFVFNPDGTFRLEENGNVAEGTWAYHPEEAHLIYVITKYNGVVVAGSNRRSYSRTLMFTKDGMIELIWKERVNIVKEVYAIK